MLSVFAPESHCLNGVRFTNLQLPNTYFAHSDGGGGGGGIVSGRIYVARGWSLARSFVNS